MVQASQLVRPPAGLHGCGGRWGGSARLLWGEGCKDGPAPRQPSDTAPTLRCAAEEGLLALKAKEEVCLLPISAHSKFSSQGWFKILLVWWSVAT